MQPQTFNAIDVLRLEVEEEQTGLRNGIANPSGELGGWGWLTPVANTSMTGEADPTRLRFTTTVNQAVHFTSEPIPVTPGHYVGGRLTLGGTNDSPTVRYVRGRIDFHDSAGVLVSSGSFTAYTSTISGTVLQVTGVVVPAGAAYAALRVGFYSSNLGGNPAAGAWVKFHSAVLATSPTAGELGSVRTNLFRRPGFEVSPLGTFVESNNSSGTFPGLSTTIKYAGTYALQLERGGVAGTEGLIDATMGFGLAAVPVEAYRDYAVQLQIRASVTVFVYVEAQWFGSGFEALGTVLLRLVEAQTATWTFVDQVKEAPAGAAYLRIRVRSGTPVPAASKIYVDAVMVEQSSTVGTYFDGNTPDAGGVDYAWTGTANDSTSTATVPGDLPYIPPVSYLNVLGPTHSIDVVREALQVGTLTATVLDAALAPYEAEGIRPGRACRLMVRTHGGTWCPLFTGELDTAAVTFDRKRITPGSTDPKRARVQLVAIDNTAKLAGTPRAEGVATIGELPYVLEGAGVPWSVNGSGAQVSTATVTTINENATAVDQVALTRDTAGGYAWVDTDGILQAYDAASLPSSTEVIGEDLYSGIDLGYDTEACINTVTVVTQQIDPVTGTTDELTWGPYVDSESVRVYGARAATFTIAPAVVDEASVSAYAAGILTANSTPRVRASAVTVPILDSALHLSTVAGDRVAMLELYDLVTVSNTAETYSEAQRVTSLRHTIRARRKSTGPTWVMVAGFAPEGAVASPQAIPAPGTGGGGQTLAQLLRPVGEVSMWFGAKVDCPPGWLVMDGTAIPAEYPELIELVGATLPDMTDVMPIGAGTKALGASGGSATKVIADVNLPPHTHLMTHTHPVPRKANVGSASGYARGNATSEPNDDTGASSRSDTGNGPGTSTPLDVMPPWRALWFIIRAK